MPNAMYVACKYIEVYPLNRFVQMYIQSSHLFVFISFLKKITN